MFSTKVWLPQKNHVFPVANTLKRGELETKEVRAVLGLVNNRRIASILLMVSTLQVHVVHRGLLPPRPSNCH